MIRPFDRAQLLARADSSPDPVNARRSVRRLVRVVNLAKRGGIEVCYDGSIKGKGLYFRRQRRIVIHPNIPVERQVITILHELGHASVTRNQRRTRFNRGHFTRGPLDRTKVLHVLSEEMLAWRRALRLARHHGLGIDRALFEHVMLESVATYVRWAGSRHLMGRRRRFRR